MLASSQLVGCSMELECSAKAEVAKSQLRTDLWVPSFFGLGYCWSVLCMLKGRGYGRLHLIYPGLGI